MSSWPTSPIRWIRRLFDRSKPPEPSDSWEEQITTGGLAVLSLESLICEHLCRSLRAPTDGPGQPWSEPGGELPNAFGKRSMETPVESPRQALAMASGVTLSGIRSCAFLAGADLPRVHDQLFALAGRHLPLVVHAVCRAVPRQGSTPDSGHDCYHAVADSGLFLAFARNAQQAVDLALVTRRLSELSLVPGLVAMDAVETASAAQDLVLPTRRVIREYLGPPESLIDCPTDGQRLLFGENRRLVPLWFDFLRPTALGAFQTGADFGLGLAGEAAFFSTALAPLAQQAMARLDQITGHSLSWLSRHRLDDARFVLVVQGSAIEIAERAVDRLREEHRWPMGVLGITWLRPFPSDEIKAALEKAKVVVVLERASEPLAGLPPLYREISAVVGSDGPALESVVYGLGGTSLTVGQLAGLYRRLAAGNLPRGPSYLGIETTAGSSGWPRREVYVQSVARLLSTTDLAVVGPDKSLDARPQGARTLTIHTGSALVDDLLLARLATDLAAVSSRHVRARHRLLGDDCWLLHLTFSPTPFADPGEDTPVDLAVVLSMDLPGWIDPFEHVVPNGAALVVTDIGPDVLWTRLAATWCSSVETRRIRLFQAKKPAAFEDLVQVIASLLSGQIEGLTEVSPTAPVERPSQQELGPSDLVSRRREIGVRYDNLPRFWGEVVQPRLLGEVPRPIPDPLLALNALPSTTAALFDRSPSREQVPVLLASQCTGCGQCWVACPDAALAPVAVTTRALLDSVAQEVQAGPAVERLRRLHEPLAGRVDKLLAARQATVATPELFGEAFSWLLERMDAELEEKESLATAFDGIMAGLGRLDAVVTQPFFHRPRDADAGEGNLLLLAIDPRTCKGCGLCAAACPGSALQMVPQTTDLLARMGSGWRLWERIEDTSGTILSSLLESAEISPLAAVQASRHFLRTMAGSDVAEPGSGERLATRSVLSLVEYSSQLRLRRLASGLSDLIEQLKDKIQSLMSSALPSDDLEALHKALASTHGRFSDVRQLIEEIQAQGRGTTIDVRWMKRLVDLTRQLELRYREVTHGVDGLGMARYGLVVDSKLAESWALRFPRNPFGVPVTVAPSSDSPGVAQGLMAGLISRWVADARLIRLARFLLKDPPLAKLQVEETTLSRLSWEDLEAGEREGCPPILLLARTESVGFRGLAEIGHVAGMAYPLKVILLDGKDPIGGLDPVLAVVGQPTTALVSVSIAHPHHFHDSLMAVLEYPGTAVVHIYAPSPGRHGYPPQETLERSAVAVDTRVHPLLRYLPGDAPGLGFHLTLEGNPAPEAEWVTDPDGQAITPRLWAHGEQRYAGGLETADRPAKARNLVEYRRRTWRVLQEIAGVVTPFASRERTRIQEEMERTKKEEMDRLASDYEQGLREMETRHQAALAEQLKERLLQLAGYGEPPEGGDDDR